MKKIYYLMLMMLPFFMQSCLKDDDEVFDKNPSERMDEALKEYKSLLASSEKGWVMEYYAAPGQIYGGYVFAMEFTESSVTAYSDLALNQKSTSLYQLIADDGPVLSFDTYNMFLHFFSDPSADMYEAFQGEFEFILMGTSDDKSEIYLKGKKTGNRMTMRRLEVSATEYVGSTVDMYNAVNTAPKYGAIVEGDSVDCTIAGNYLSMAYTDNDASVQTVDMAFCYTPTGIRFYQPITINGVEIASMTYDAETGNLQSAGGELIIYKAKSPLNEIFMTKLWSVNAKNSSAAIQPYFDAVRAASAKENETVGYFQLGGSESFPGYFTWYFLSVINGTSNGYAGNIVYQYKLIGDDKIMLSIYSYDSNGQYYYQGGYSQFANALHGKTFQLAADNLVNTSVITMTDTNNPDFVIMLQSEMLVYPLNY